MNIQKECDQIVDLLEQDEVVPAVREAEELCRRYPQDSRVLYVYASALRAAGDARECQRIATRALSGIDSERPELADLRDPFRILLGWAAWQQWDFGAAEQHLRQALGSSPMDAEAWDLLAAILEHTGRAEEAASAGLRASELDPEVFPVPVKLSEDRLEAAVRNALDELPEELARIIQELPIVIQEFPTREMAAPDSANEQPLGPDTLGLFVGASQLDKSYLSPVEHPGAIFLFKRNLERMCPDQETLEEELILTLHHELAHFAGFEEDQMPELGLE
jgi:predicted Zn-dependent protease with MMP-like domain